jgi:hypothetical protein
VGKGESPFTVIAIPGTGDGSWFAGSMMGGAGTYTNTFTDFYGAFDTYPYEGAIVAFHDANSTVQTSDLLDVQSYSGTMLSGINGMGQFQLPVTAGLPTNTPRIGTALSGEGAIA